MHRREFLKSVPAAAGAAAMVTAIRDAGAQTPRLAGDVRISSQPSAPVQPGIWNRELGTGNPEPIRVR